MPQPAAVPSCSSSRCARALTGGGVALLALAIWVVLSLHAPAAHALGPAPAVPPPAPVAPVAALATRPVQQVEPVTAPVRGTVAHTTEGIRRTVHRVTVAVPATRVLEPAVASLLDGLTTAPRAPHAIVRRSRARALPPPSGHEHTAVRVVTRRAAARVVSPARARVAHHRRRSGGTRVPSAPQPFDLLAIPLSTSSGSASRSGARGSGELAVLPRRDLPIPSRGRRLGRFGADRPVLLLAFFVEQPG